MNFSITYNEAKTILQQMKSYADAMKDNLDDVSIISNYLTGGDWKGQSAEQYKATFNELRPKFDMFYNDVVSCINTINTAMQAYQSGDQSVSVTFAKE